MRNVRVDLMKIRKVERGAKVPTQLNNYQREAKGEGMTIASTNLWIDEVLKTYDNNIIKIVAMHHHLIAIPDTGFTNLVGIAIK